MGVCSIIFFRKKINFSNQLFIGHAIEVNIDRMDLIKTIQHVKQGEPKAEHYLYTFLYEHLFKIALVYCDDDEEAKSVFNHSMLDIFQQIKEFKTKEDLLRWSRRILKNDCIDHNRKKCVYKNKLEVLSTRTPHERLETDGVLNELYFKDLLSLLKFLKPKYRLCLVLHVLEGYNYNEIAEQLDLNINTAKWYTAEAKKKLKSMLSTKHVNDYR